VISCLEGLTYMVKVLSGGGAQNLARSSSSVIAPPDGVHKAAEEGAAVAGEELVHVGVEEADVPAEDLPSVP